MYYGGLGVFHPLMIVVYIVLRCLIGMFICNNIIIIIIRALAMDVYALIMLIASVFTANAIYVLGMFSWTASTSGTPGFSSQMTRHYGPVCWLSVCTYCPLQGGLSYYEYTEPHTALGLSIYVADITLSRDHTTTEDEKRESLSC